MLKKSLIVALMYGLWPLTVTAQTSGVGISAMVGTGYGLYVVTMRPSAQAGAISSFYLYSHSGAWPSRWQEIDLEFTPGFIGTGKIDDPFSPSVLATGTSDQHGCYSAAKGSNNLPLHAEDCRLTPTPPSRGINSYLSINAYNHRAWDSYPTAGGAGLLYPHSNNQVFLPSVHGAAIYQQLHTYFFYYTPNGIYWSKDLPVIPLLKDQLPPEALLKSPIAFVKKDVRIVNANALWSPKDHAIDVRPGQSIKAPEVPLNEAFVYDKLPLTPLLEDKKTLAETGTLMYVSMNLWDGSCSGSKGCGDPSSWGGPKSPPSRTLDRSEYQQVAYYPLQTPVAIASTVLDPSTLNYGKPALYSDFSKGIFLVNQQSIAFSKLWHVTDGIYLYPLGILDERNLGCGYGQNLTMTFSEVKVPRRNDDRSSFKVCPWLGDNDA